MSKLSQFNPAKRLFLRVFLYFWLAALLIFLSSMWLAKQLDSEVKYLPLNQAQQQDLMSTTMKLQQQIDRRRGDLNLNRMVNQAARRYRLGVIIIDNQTREMTYQLVRDRQPNQEIFANFDLQSSALLVAMHDMAFIGPSVLKVKQKEYLLFLVMPRPRGALGTIRHEFPGFFILFICCLSAALCYLFVRGLLKPILQLQQASKRMASGEMGVRVGSASLRTDELGQLSRDFNHMSKQVESLLNNQKRLLADISHELRSPLARLQLSIGIALQQDESTVSSNMGNALDRIEREALKIEQMIAQVLLLSRLDNQHPITNLEQVSIDHIMQPLISDAQFEAKQKNKTLSYKPGPDITINAELPILSSAIENVLRNAIHYSRTVIDVTVSAEDGYITWTIEDDGNGIEDSQLSRVFEAFYRESTARDRDSGGVGLGLAIAHHAIAKHQGTIWASNKPKGGLVVKISIPLLLKKHS